MQRLTLTQPDDWHLHVRDGAAMQAVIGASARCFGRAIIMPNLKPPVTTVADALAYRERICAALPEGNDFTPLMTLYLTDQTTVEDIKAAAACTHVVGAKLYPAGATTNSDSGVSDLRKMWPIFEAMQAEKFPLLVHGEVTASSVDIFDRERVFIEHVLDPLLADFPELSVVLEHITTKDAAEYVAAAADNIAATITVHHLLLDRNDMLVGGIRPHYYCLPILKRGTHRHALLQAATSGSPKFFLGTDSAPHATHAKESSCGCAGVYSAPAAIELYAEAFEQVEALDKLEGFASHFGADFYGLPRNTKTITLEKNAWQMPKELNYGEDKIIPLRAGELIQWQQV